MSRSAARPLALAAALVALLAPAAAHAAPAPPRDGRAIARLVAQLDRSTPMTLVGQVTLQGDTWHPEGLVRRGDEWLLSTVEVTEPTVRYPDGPIDGTDRTAGAGVGHLLRFAADGTRLDDQVLTGTRPEEYHPGGLDYDGRDLWVTMSQYRPNSTATFERIDPETLEATPVLQAADHYGGVVHDTARRRLVTLNWGARAGASWRIPRRDDGRVRTPQRPVKNPSSFVDYQDCKYLGRVRAFGDPLMLCGGITGYGAFQLGGIALVSTRTLAPVHEVPITTLTPAGNVTTRNPIDVEVVDGKLRLHLAPDDDTTTVYTYEAG